MKKIFNVIKRFKRNIYYLLKIDLWNEKENMNDNTNTVNNVLLNQIDFWYEAHKDQQVNMEKELDFLRTERKVNAFPYPKTETLQNIETGFDKKRKLSFVMHNSKRLYFSKSFSQESAGSSYKNYIDVENLLGIEQKDAVYGTPHKYQDEKISVEQGDILLDIGCAEALFALDNIEKVSKLYLFEANPEWYDALEATFEPYKDKVVLIKKLVSDVDDENSITLQTALKNEKNGKFFMKMDIEGYEEKVIQSSKSFLTNNEVKLSVCTYHLFDAQKRIPDLLASYGFSGNFSSGYMLFYLYDFRPPFLRKGVYRAKNF